MTPAGLSLHLMKEHSEKEVKDNEQCIISRSKTPHATFQGATVDWFIKADDIVIKNEALNKTFQKRAISKYKGVMYA